MLGFPKRFSTVALPKMEPPDFWVSRVLPDKVVYFGWVAPLIESATHTDSAQVLKKFGIPACGWRPFMTTFTPVLLSRIEYDSLQKLGGGFIWCLTPIRNRHWRE